MLNALTIDFFDEETALPAKAKPSRQSQLGQFLTAPSVAGFMAGMFGPMDSNVIRLLDAGAGAGALSFAFVDRWTEERAAASTLAIAAYELDEAIQPALAECLDGLQQIRGIETRLVKGDFLEHAATMIRLERGERYTHAILNPPYKKISTASTHRQLLRAAGVETVNLYSGFVALSLELLEQGGEMVAIIPRSFCNGPYYEPFRHFLLERAALRRIHLFGARNKAFKSDGVLQENVIIHLERGASQGDVIVSTSADDSFADLETATYPFAKIINPQDAARFIHIPSGEDLLLLRAAALQHGLADIGVKVSTGPVVDFRMREHLRADSGPGTVPLLYPGHFTAEGIEWPKAGFKKPNAIAHTMDTQKWLYPTGFYTVVRRFSSKEERRRVVANVVDPAALPYPWLGLENHLNVFHIGREPLSEDLARGLATYLNSTAVDQYFRQFNGHTQVNATDLRNMRYPNHATLAALGQWAKGRTLTQSQIDEKVNSLA